MGEETVFVPSVELNSLHKMPRIGFGTWLLKPENVGNIIKNAIKCGYRHIDCAFIYGNQREIGKALNEVFEERIVKREELFITSKVWNTFHSHKRALKNIDMILNELGIDYLDLCLIHWPMGYKEGEDLFPKVDNKILLSDVDFMETWGALEEAVFKEKVRSIGLSNFNAKQIQKVISNCRIRPAVLQTEIHVYFQQDELFKFCKVNGINVVASCPLASSNENPFRKSDYPSVFNDPVIKKIADELGQTNAQIALHYLIQKGLSVIPKSSNEERMSENIKIIKFLLNDEQMEKMSKLNTGKRIIHLELSCHSPLYPWK
uniref:NADP-dependent oxidoreductase domain-containing protein n=1 Tax=Meloidogyne incognita TaxID=6306 RepID=A0A914LP95_MELIC